MNFKKQIVSANLAKNVTSDGNNPHEYIIIHQTGNTSKGANAQAHANIQSKGNTRAASWHESIDDKEVIQSFEHTAKCWHAGDGRNGKGNGKGIGLELCINSDGNYKQTIENGAERTAELMKQYNIPLSHVLRHKDCSGKNCPAQINAGLHGITWDDFKNLVMKYYNGKEPVIVNPSTSKPKQKKLVEDGAWGKDTTKALQKHYGTPVDGIISGQPKNNNTRYLFSASYGKGGSTLIRAIQRDLGTPVDGIVSYKSTMIKALQRKYGTPVDGYISYPSTLIREMQKRLNNGTF